MSDLVERLRVNARVSASSFNACQSMEDAADRIEALEKTIALERRRATDAEYRADNYRMMLGTKARQVAKLWDDSGVVRVHVSWVQQAPFDDGEAMAQCHLDIHEAAKSAVPLTSEELKDF